MLLCRAADDNKGSSDSEKEPVETKAYNTENKDASSTAQLPIQQVKANINGTNQLATLT